MNNIIKNFKKSRVIRKAQYGMPIMPIFSEADAGFPNGQKQLRFNETLRQLSKLMRNRVTSIPSNDRPSVPSGTNRIPIYAEPDDTPEWLKKVYYYFNPSRKPVKVNQNKKIR